MITKPIQNQTKSQEKRKNMCIFPTHLLKHLLHVITYHFVGSLPTQATSPGENFARTVPPSPHAKPPRPTLSDTASAQTYVPPNESPIKITYFGVHLVSQGSLTLSLCVMRTIKFHPTFAVPKQTPEKVVVPKSCQPRDVDESSSTKTKVHTSQI